MQDTIFFDVFHHEAGHQISITIDGTLGVCDFVLGGEVAGLGGCVDG